MSKKIFLPHYLKVIVLLIGDSVFELPICCPDVMLWRTVPQVSLPSSLSFYLTLSSSVSTSSLLRHSLCLYPPVHQNSKKKEAFWKMRNLNYPSWLFSKIFVLLKPMQWMQLFAIWLQIWLANLTFSLGEGCARRRMMGRIIFVRPIYCDPDLLFLGCPLFLLFDT